MAHWISKIDLEDKSLTVSYEVLELDELILAYATTIHRAQSSEYPAVIMPFSFSRQRNLLYTGNHPTQATGGSSGCGHER